VTRKIKITTGHVAAWGGFFAAIAALALVVVTLVLVLVTKDVAKETRAAAEAAIRPRLADVPLGADPETITYDHMLIPLTVKLRDSAAMDVRAFYGGQSGTPTVARSFAVRNIGNGPAVIKSVQLDVGKKSLDEHLVGWASPLTIAAGETGRLMTLDFKPLLRNYSDSPGADFNEHARDLWGFTITAVYTDTDGGQRQKMTVRVVPNYYKVRGLHVAAFTVQDE
jgi:hypothetical protein